MMILKSFFKIVITRQIFKPAKNDPILIKPDLDRPKFCKFLQKFANFVKICKKFLQKFASKNDAKGLVYNQN